MTNYLGDRVLYYYEPKLLGHKGTILALKNWLNNEPFMVINGDTLSNIDYIQMILSHKKGTITIAMDEYRAIGAWIYSPEYFENQNLPIYPYRENNCVWFDIGTPERLKEARKFFE